MKKRKSVGIKIMLMKYIGNYDNKEGSSLASHRNEF